MTKTQNAGVVGSLFAGRISAGLASALLAAATLIGGATTRASARPCSACAQVVGEQYIPLRIAVPDFDAAGPGAAEIAQQLTGVIRADLTSSAPFRVLEPSSFIERDLDITEGPAVRQLDGIGSRSAGAGRRQCRGRRRHQPDDGAVPPVGRLWPEPAVRDVLRRAHAAQLAQAGAQGRRRHLPAADQAIWAISTAVWCSCRKPPATNPIAVASPSWTRMAPMPNSCSRASRR